MRSLAVARCRPRPRAGDEPYADCVHFVDLTAECVRQAMRRSGMSQFAGRMQQSSSVASKRLPVDARHAPRAGELGGSAAGQLNKHC